MLPSTSCGYLFWVGAVLMVIGIGMLPFILKQRRSPAAIGDGHSRRDYQPHAERGRSLALRRALLSFGHTAETTVGNPSFIPATMR